MSEFMAEQFTKVELLAALQHAGYPMPKKSTKVELVLGFYGLKLGPQSVARRFLLQNTKEQPAASAEAASNGREKETPTAGAQPSEEAVGTSVADGKLWVQLVGSNRGIYGESVEVDGDLVRFTRYGNGKVLELQVSEIEKATGDAALVAAVEAKA